jgi:hypothetical protein
MAPPLERAVSAPEMSRSGLLVLTAALSLCLGFVHLFSGQIRFLHVTPRSRWLSAASGVSVAYVFVHVLPDLAEGQEMVRRLLGTSAPGFLEHHVYLVALAGVAVFYGLERLAKRSRAQNAAAGEDVTSPGVFWIHVGSFAIYNALIGYLMLHREQHGAVSLVTFFVAMATHFLVNDVGLRIDHRRRYDAHGRWLLAAAVIGGWTAGAFVDVHEPSSPCSSRSSSAGWC